MAASDPTERPQEPMIEKIIAEVGEEEALLPLVESALPVPPHLISPTIGAMAKEDPKKALDFLESYDKRRFELETRKVQQQFEIEVLKAQSQTKKELAGETTKRLGMGLIVGSLITVLIYAGFTKDKELSEKIINVVVGAVGGLGAGAALFKQKNG